MEVAFYIAWRFTEDALDDRLKKLELVPQMEATLDGKKVRFDFVVFPKTRDRERAETVFQESRFIVVEIDGHDFHERTKAQVIERNWRDREITKRGGAIVHFSGSELYRGALDCVAAVVDAAEQRRLFELAD